MSGAIPLPITAAAVHALADRGMLRAMPDQDRTALVDACRKFIAAHESERSLAERSIDTDLADRCAYCINSDDSQPMCSARFDGHPGWVCTRPADHLAPHVACGSDHVHDLARWTSKP